MQLGWVDFSDSDRKKVLNVIHLLSEKGAIDELGFGIIRDGFADYFFPSTSTIQTRAKYFFIVPYILKDAVFQQHPDKYLEKREREVAKILFSKNMKTGLIGADSLASNKWVIRPPSEIYWNGLKKLEIFKQDISISQYLKECEKIKRQRTNLAGNVGKEEGECDDADASKDSIYNFWNIPSYSKNWEEKLELDLTKKEAVFLKKRILSLKTKQNTETLYSFIIGNNIQIDKYSDFEAMYVDLKDKVDSELCEMMKLANDFNYLAMIAKCRYNILLSGKTNNLANEIWNENKNQLNKIACVDVGKIFEKLNLHNVSLKSFLMQLQIELKKNNIDKVDELIKIRERKIKGHERAKLFHPDKYLPNAFSDVFVGGLFFDYRMNSAKRIINDIYEVENV